MRKELFVTSTLFLLLAGTALAAPTEKTQRNNRPVIHWENLTPEPTHSVSPTVRPSVTPVCNTDEEWENHGAYVSCVAKQKLGGEYVSKAAQSTVGKKDDEAKEQKSEDEDKKHARLTPTGTPAVTPNTTPTVTPNQQSEQNEIRNLIAELQTILEKLYKLLPSFKHNK